jgi:hypothetical protein
MTSFGPRLFLPVFSCRTKKAEFMEFVCIEAKAFMEMNEALEAVEKQMRETCGEGICSMDDWIDNQEACMLMNVSPRKLLQLRRSRIIPYSHIDRKVYYRRQDIIYYLENSITM